MKSQIFSCRNASGKQSWKYRIVEIEKWSNSRRFFIDYSNFILLLIFFKKKRKSISAHFSSFQLLIRQKNGEGSNFFHTEIFQKSNFRKRESWKWKDGQRNFFAETC